MQSPIAMPSFAPAAGLIACLLLGLMVAGAGGCGETPAADLREGTVVVTPGLEVERTRPSSDAPLLTVVHVDPTRYELRLLTAQEHGRARTAKAWADDFSLTGVINASMYMPNLRSTGLMRRGDVVNNGAINPRFEGFLAFGPRREGLPPVRMAGSDCGDVDSLLVDYDVVVQNYRLLDCEGEAIEWRDPKTYSSAAIGIDDRGWVVFAHSGGPCRTSDFSRWLADPERRIDAAVFVEGGPDASLHLDAHGYSLEVIGSYPGGASGGRGREIPNVVGFGPRGAQSSD